MAVVITEIIPQQGFEIVLNKLGAILFEEITNQVTIQSFTDEVEVYVERMYPYDKSEDVLINVSLNSIDFQGQTQGGTQGNVTYYVDVYCRGEETNASTGSEASKMKINRYLGIIRYILCSTKYKQLGFTSPLVGRVSVNNLQQDPNSGRMDAAYLKFGRITVNVAVNEAQDLWDGIPLMGNDTMVNLENTNKGFKLTFNN